MVALLNQEQKPHHLTRSLDSPAAVRGLQTVEALVMCVVRILQTLVFSRKQSQRRKRILPSLMLQLGRCQVLHHIQIPAVMMMTLYDDH